MSLLKDVVDNCLRLPTMIRKCDYVMKIKHADIWVRFAFALEFPGRINEKL